MKVINCKDSNIQGKFMAFVHSGATILCALHTQALLWFLCIFPISSASSTFQFFQLCSCLPRCAHYIVLLRLSSQSSQFQASCIVYFLCPFLARDPSQQSFISLKKKAPQMAKLFSSYSSAIRCNVVGFKVVCAFTFLSRPTTQPVRHLCLHRPMYPWFQ